MNLDLEQIKHAVVGRPVSEVETPALILDADLLEQNIRRMADFFKNRPAALRPHIKTHKSPVIGRMQVEAGAIGLTCAKLGEAEVMVEAGLNAILIANQVVGPSRAIRLARLSAQADVLAAVDSVENVAELSAAAAQVGSTIGLLVEVDVGMSRAGARSPAESVRLAEAIGRARNLELRGLMGYEGHAVFKADRSERAHLAELANATLLAHTEAVRERGFAAEIVSAGGTGTYDLAGSRAGITEIQAGSYATMDGRYKGVIPEFDNALTLLSTVVSRPSRDRAVLDCGMKSITAEFGLPTVREAPEAVLLGLSEEHGKLELGEGARSLCVGDKVHLIPSHGCTTINLHDLYVVARNGVVVDIWPVAARGRFR